MTDTIELTAYPFQTSEKFTLSFIVAPPEATYQATEDVKVSLEWRKIKRLFNSIIADLERYEAEYEMDSEHFYNAFQSGEINEEREGLYDWRSKYTAYRQMSQRFRLTR